MRHHILYFGNVWFTENRTSSHHIARQLARQHDVHYFECAGLRAPSGSKRDLLKLMRQIRRAFARPVMSDGVMVRPLLQIPLHRFSIIRRLNHWLLRSAVRRVIRREKMAAPISWFTVPHVASVAGALGEAAIVYYCIDDYSAIPGVNVAAVRAMDEELTRRASVCFVASETLLLTKTRLNPNTHLSPHGVDVAHFGKARNGCPLPADVAHLTGPVVGFFGLIEDYIDLELLDHLADRRPDWTFLMIGRVAVPAECVPQRSNLLFIGPRPYESLPDYGRQFSAAVIPYRVTEFTYHANPLKLREYLAMGVPVVATRTPQTAKFGDVASIVESRDEWLRALDEAITAPPDQGLVRARTEVVAECSWQARVQHVWQIVRAVVADRQQRNAAGGPWPAAASESSAK